MYHLPRSWLTSVSPLCVCLLCFPPQPHPLHLRGTVQAHDGGVHVISLLRVPGSSPQLITCGADKTVAIWDTMAFQVGLERCCLEWQSPPSHYNVNRKTVIGACCSGPALSIAKEMRLA